MQTYRIPHTDLEVSRLAFGTMHLGGTWDKTPPTADIKERANQLIKAVYEHGINHIDLADIYTKGKSDEVVGYALAQNPGLRDKLVIQAKSGIILGDDPNPGDPGRYDFSYENLVGKVEETLRLVGTDHVELLALHRPDPLVELEEVARAFDHLHSSGKVRYFGVSNHSASQIALLKKYVDQPIVLNQLELSIMHHHLISEGILVNNAGWDYANASGTLDYCRLHSIMIQAWSPVAGGSVFRSGKEATERETAVSSALNEIAAAHNTTPDAIAYAWLLRHPATIQPILGTMNINRIANIIPADDVQLTRIEWYQLLAAARGAGVP